MAFQIKIVILQFRPEKWYGVKDSEVITDLTNHYQFRCCPQFPTCLSEVTLFSPRATKSYANSSPYQTGSPSSVSKRTSQSPLIEIRTSPNWVCRAGLSATSDRCSVSSCSCDTSRGSLRVIKATWWVLVSGRSVPWSLQWDRRSAGSFLCLSGCSPVDASDWFAVWCVWHYWCFMKLVGGF